MPGKNEKGLEPFCEVEPPHNGCEVDLPNVKVFAELFHIAVGKHTLIASVSDDRC